MAHTDPSSVVVDCGICHTLFFGWTDGSHCVWMEGLPSWSLSTNTCVVSCGTTGVLAARYMDKPLGHELIQNGGACGSHACSTTLWGSVSVDKCDPHRSAKRSAGEDVLVHGYVCHQTSTQTQVLLLQ